ncbi:MAG: hypothetical protein ACP5OR_08585 [Candidatus Dormibacteria bacterium]
MALTFRNGYVRFYLTALVCMGALVADILFLWSTCTVAGCGSFHSSIWARVILLIVPLLIITIQAWKVVQTDGHSPVVLGNVLPWLIAGTLVSAWSIAYVPIGTQSQTMMSESMVMPLVVLFNAAVIVATWCSVLAVIGFPRVRHHLSKYLVSSHGRWWFTFSTGIALVFAWLVAATPAFGATGMDVYPHEPGASVPTTFVTIDECSDARMVHCWMVVQHVQQGDSFNFAPGVYTIENSPPHGYSCEGITPTPFQLYPFERIQVSFIHVACHKLHAR